MYHFLLTLLKNLCSLLSPTIINFNSEAAVTSAVNKVVDTLAFSIGCNCHSNQWLWRQIEVWNINKHRHGSKNAVEGWKYKLNSIRGMQQPNIFLSYADLKKKQCWYLDN
jgi:hypothetical protein